MSWLLAALGFAALIILHELGHFTAAKAVGMRVERFSLFFGRTRLRVQRWETEYGIGWLPLGRFVKISGMNPAEEIPADAIVRLEFLLYVHPSTESGDKAKVALQSFAEGLARAVTTAFDRAVAMTAGLPDARRREVTLALTSDSLSTSVTTLVAQNQLSTYFVGDRPASDAVLEKIGFEKTAAGRY